MKKTKNLLFIFTFLISFTGAFSQTFNKSTDLLLANYDLLPDMDDVHSIAAMGSMLKHEDYQDINYWAVAGAYGKQTGYDYIHTVAPEFMTLCFGAQNVKWTDAHNDWSGSVTRVTAEVVEILNAGGNVWVQEGGQSDFSYDVAQAAMADGVSADKIKNNFIIVQHSNWNTNQSTEKSWLNSGDVNYVKIEDCNNAGNGTPAYKEAASSYMTAAISEDNPNGYAQAFWDMANDICEDWSASNPTIVAGGIDFSDHGENWYIFGWDDKYMTVQEFMDEFVTNSIGPVDFPPTVNFVTPTKTSYTIPEGSVGVDIVPVEISATDDDSVSSVELYLDNELISSDASAPYTWTNDAVLKNMTEGTYTLKAIVEDNGGQTSEASLTITVAPEDSEGNGVEYGDHWVVCEAENTKSPKGLWELRKDGDAAYFEGASNDQYLEFTGNDAPGRGSDRSPLTYTFTAPKTAQYELLMRFHQNLDNGVGGTYAGDYCNDVYITMAGNFTSGHAKLSEEELRTEQKFFGKGRDWGVGYRITMYTDGEKNYPAKYNLIQGEEYTFTIAGRSKQACIDYWLFVDNSEISSMPTAQMDMYTELDAKYRPASENTDPGETVAVTGVSVNPTTAEISSIGSTKQLNATVSPSNASNSKVVWSSSNDAVATVSQTGLVTAKTEGTATITATTEDGDFTANSSITVSIGTGGCATFSKIEGEAYDDMFGVTVGGSRDTDGTDAVKDPQAGDWVMYSDIDLTCAKSVSARVASYRIGGNIEVRIDAVDGELIGTIEQGTTGAWTAWVTASANITSVSGVHNVYLVFTDGSNTTLYLNWFEFSTDDTALSTVEFDLDLIQIYPNPATSQLNIKWRGFNNTAQISIINTIGQTLISNEYNNETNAIDISRLPVGTYVVKVENNEHILTKKFVKQ